MDKAKILIVEDNKELLEMYDFKLSREGFTVVTAHDGEDGLQKAIDERPDLILMDVLMPNMNGFDLLKAIRNNTSINVPIILLSNLGQQEQIDKGYQLGATAYLVKANYTPSEVVEKLKGFLSMGVQNNKYLLKLDPNHYDYDKLVEVLPEPVQSDKCAECYGEIGLELKTIKGTKGKFEAQFVCTKCGKNY